MKIIALDSSAKVCTVALCEDENILCEITVNNGNTHSQTLLPCVAQLLKLSDITIDDVDMIACSVGPGSFTGVRIGVATVKGLAYGKNKICVGISSLDALARNLVNYNGIICSVMDARREHVYNALYKCKNGKLECLCHDRLISIEELDRELSLFEEKIYLSGDGYDVCKKYFKLTDVEYVPYKMRMPSGYSISLCAIEKYKCGGACTDFELSPVYLRPSQAERERLEKLKG